jgi:citrate lyase beta subunit
MVQGQPVSTLYGGAHLFKRDSAPKMGKIALAALEAHTGTPEALREVFGDVGDAAAILARVRAKLETSPVSDQRIDFEDGYGVRSTADEDGDAVRTAHEVAAALEEGTLAPRVGIRIRSMAQETRARALRTLDLFVTELARETARWPAGFVVTVPKVTRPDEVEELVHALEDVELRAGLAAGAIGLEIMIEAPEILVGPDGTIPLARVARAHQPRLRGAHLGSYDLTARLDVSAHDQSIHHPACELARMLAKMALAGTSVVLSDGATTLLPIAAKDASPEETSRAVRTAWKMHAWDVRESLRRGIHQGWDLHPTQLVSRYVAVFAYYRAALEQAQTRFAGFLAAGARATALGSAFDDAATAEGLLGFFRRGLACGALDAADLEPAGLEPADFAEGAGIRQIIARRSGGR